jgi:hypothetical protein
MIESRIKLAQEIIQANEKNIEAQRGDIETQKREIDSLSILQKRLKRIQAVKHHENVGNSEDIIRLANTKNVADFVEELSNVIDIRVQPSVSEMPLLRLTVWQALFLLFGDHDKITKNLSQPEAAELNEDIQDAPSV